MFLMKIKVRIAILILSPTISKWELFGPLPNWPSEGSFVVVVWFASIRQEAGIEREGGEQEAQPNVGSSP